MPKRKGRPALKSFIHDPQPLDLDEFSALTDLLFVAMNENHAACARVVGVSRLTWRKWETKPPTWPYWNFILREILKLTMANMHAQRKGHMDTHKKYIEENLAKIPHGNELFRQVNEHTLQISGAQDHLLKLLSQGGMYVHEIRRPANSGGYSDTALRTAARKLGIKKHAVGFGTDKRVKWKLPKQHNVSEDMEIYDQSEES